MSKKDNIRNDLKQGLTINMLENMSRYGTSMRSRVSELRNDEHLLIASIIVDNKSQALGYFMPQYKQARQEVKNFLHAKRCDFGFNEIHTLQNDSGDAVFFKDLDLVEAVKLLKSGYKIYPF